MTMLTLPAPTLLSVRIPFCGFYESSYSWEIDHHVQQETEYWASGDAAEARAENTPAIAEIEYALTQEQLQDFFNEAFWDCVDYSEAYLHMARAYVDEFASWLEDSLDVPVAFEFEEMTSPRYYNYETDRIFGKLSLTVFEEMRRRLSEEAPGSSENAFKVCFTSYDGFHSFYDSTVPDKPLEEWDHNELYALLGAWCNYAEDQVIWDFLYDWSLGGLYEEVYRAVDQNLDYGRLAEKAEIWADERREELNLVGEEAPYRCPNTLELPL